MKRLHVNLPGSDYDIFIGKGLLDKAWEMISKVFKGKRVAIVSDDRVYGLYGSRLEAQLSSAGVDFKAIVIPQGEESKSLSKCQECYGFFAEMGLNRGDLIIAFGGGVIGDLAGFLAATYMRGLPYVQIPTTLLSLVDSSVGGKTAVNLPQGKNLVGAFKQPIMVISDTELVSTLTDREFASGISEVIKYAAISSPALFELLKTNNSRSLAESCLEEIVCMCCDIKRGIVEVDQFDNKERMVLNFGHTIGHAIEKLYDLEKFNHGEAVAIGMKYMLMLGERLGLTDSSCFGLIPLLKDFNLPIDNTIELGKLINFIKLDKKGMSDSISIILIKTIGESLIYKADFKTVENFLNSIENGEGA